MLKVIAETAYPLRAASARVRVASFVPFLDGHGVTLDYRPTMTDSQYSILSMGESGVRKPWALASSAMRVAVSSAAHRGDLVMVHRLRSLIPVPVLEFAARPDVYDFDDALFLGSGPGTRRGSALVKREAKRWQHYVRSARLVLAGAEHLAAEARKWNGRVEVVPSCVDPARHSLHEHRDHSPVTVGWIGSPATTPFIEAVLPVFERLNGDRTRARLLVIGGSRLAHKSWLEQRPWSLAREAADLAELDIGIMPLPDSPWARGKCGYKLLQYFAAGVPAVASPVGVNSRLIGDDRGRLPDSEADWEAALSELIADAGARAQMGAAGRRFVEREYSYERWAPELAAMLRSLEC